MKHYVLSVFIATMRLIEASLGDKPTNNGSVKNYVTPWNPIIYPGSSIFGRYKGSIPRSREIAGQLALNYNGSNDGTFKNLNTENFISYTTCSISNDYQKSINSILSEIKNQFNENYALFNALDIKDNNLTLLLYDHLLYSPNIATYFNNNCSNISCMYSLYFRSINGICNFAIVHKKQN